MSHIDGIAGMYNLLVEGEYEFADHHVPLDVFIEMLEDGELPDEVAVAGLEDTLLDGDEETITRMLAVMRRRRDWLDSRDPLPTIQFIIDGEFQDTGESYELLIDGEFHSLAPLFGRNISQREPGWLVTSFRV